jgi:hypothetical protein
VIGSRVLRAGQEVAVPRYYFDVLNGLDSVYDDDGAEFDNSDAAVHAAARSAAEIGSSRLAKGDTRAVVIEVRDNRNQRVGTVTASMTIKRHPA